MKGNVYEQCRVHSRNRGLRRVARGCASWDRFATLGPIGKANPVRVIS